MKKIIKKINFRKEAGFTLVEMLVATAVFLTAVTTATGIFVTVLHSQRKSNVQRQTAQDARYAIETIAREARMATGSNTAPAINVVAGQLILTTKDYSTGDLVTKTFYLDVVSKKIMLQVIKNGVIQGTNPITTDDLDVTGFNLNNYNYGVSWSAPDRQPSVTISITSRQKAGATQAYQQAETTLRTTISSRDYKYAE